VDPRGLALLRDAQRDNGRRAVREHERECGDDVERLGPPVHVDPLRAAGLRHRRYGNGPRRGAMLNAAQQSLGTAPHISLAPGMATLTLVVALTSSATAFGTPSG